VVTFGRFALIFAFADCCGGIMRLCDAMWAVPKNKTAAHANALARFRM